MPAHVMELPRTVVVGSGLTRQVGEILGDLELGKNSLILSGTHVRELVARSFTTAMSRGGFLANWEIVGPSTFQEVERISTLAKKLGSDFLIGVGGGRSIDIAKLASFDSKIPFVSIPTSASHDGISSPFGSVKGLDRPYSLVAKPPIAIVADTDLIIRAPHNLLVSGCGDLISKKTAVKDWELSHEKTGEYYGRYSANLALLSANMIMEDADQISTPDSESISVVVEALISSGVAAGIAGSSRPCSGSEHLFSHAMDLVAPGKGLHGEKCGMGTIMMAKLHGLNYDEIRSSLKTVGCPVTAGDIGASSEEIVKALVLARSIRKERYTILEETKLTEETARKLAQDVGVIP
ncbi:MAG: NAD(P)-dependent glycerol-1-phosphate dehydrogenase [Thaumarchaeota archaeon]|nr:NAD(P)-dependent glycerol-1-phosphate dehydrogenase [Nitrososphaerota archaeon]